VLRDDNRQGSENETADCVDDRLTEKMRLKINDQQLEYEWHGPPPEEAPTLVFLHEGLGCVAMWKDFPARVARATGCGALVYSRAGYGKSSPCTLPRALRFMHDEALTSLPQVLDALAIREAILIGHSDGGSIALIHAGTFQKPDHHDPETHGNGATRISGLVLLAPHVFVEETGLESIKRIREDYRTGSLRWRLERYHGANVDGAFRGWNDVWLNPEFRLWNIEEYLPQITVPVLLIQGEQDRYGTLAQIEAIEKGVAAPVQKLILKDCGHSPHLDQPEQTCGAIARFLGDVTT
jgi:pimeloyl-ACP methyl ester carboxylesterase